MANFNEAYNITMHNEGGYCNDPQDHGGETWCGIARNFWSKWPGWPIVDHIKSTHPASLNKTLGADPQLKLLVAQFYKTNFWDCLCLDNIKCQQTGNQLFDTAVNTVAGTAARFLQNAINVLTNNTITVDGKIDVKIIEAANDIEMDKLYNQINIFRTERYEQIIAKNPSQAKFRNSWFSRIKPYESSNTSDTMA